MYKSVLKMKVLQQKIVVLLLISSPLFAQQKENRVNEKHEIKVNALLIAQYALDVSYENLIDSDSSVGASFLYVYDKFDNLNYLITPYYRHFSGKKYASGFFVEGFAMLVSEKTVKARQEGNVFYGANTAKTYIGIGAGIGTKFMFKRNIVLEFDLGLAKPLAKKHSFSLLGVIPKVGICVGKRF